MNRVWPRRVAGILVSAAATGVASLLAAIALRITQGRTSDLWWLEDHFQLLRFVLWCSILAVPVHAMNALAVLLLRRIGHDSLLATCLVGGSIGLIWFATLALLTFATGWPNLFDVVATFSVVAVPACLYWWYVVRQERAIARRLEEETVAIAAMD